MVLKSTTVTVIPGMVEAGVSSTRTTELRSNPWPVRITSPSNVFFTLLGAMEVSPTGSSAADFCVFPHEADRKRRATAARAMLPLRAPQRESECRQEPA